MTISQTLTAPARTGATRGRASVAGLLTPARTAALKTTLWGLSFPLGLLALWWISSEAGWLPAQILPAPLVIWESFAELLRDGSLWVHTWASLERVAIGFALGALFGLIFGAASGLSPTFRAYFYPPVQAVARVNVLAWMPLLALFLGIDEELKYVIIAWSTAIPIILGTARGIENVSPSLLELGAAFNFRTRDRLRLIVLPASLPSIFTGLREGLANAWQTLVLVELFASFEGLGYLMVWGRQLFQLELVIVSMIIIGVIGLLLNIVLRWIEGLGQHWKTEVGDER